jgi:hypothetical protein
LVLTEPKTERSQRTIAVPAPLVEALRKQRVAQNEERLVPTASGTTRLCATERPPHHPTADARWQIVASPVLLQELAAVLAGPKFRR